MIVATQDELNEVLTRWGCCPFPLFPGPQKKCRSVSGSLASEGYVRPLPVPDPVYDGDGNVIPPKPNPPPPWSIYLKHHWKEENSFSGKEPSYFPGEFPPDGDAYTGIEWSGGFNKTYGGSYKKAFRGGVSDGKSCPAIESGFDLVCSYAGSWKRKLISWGVHAMGEENVRFITDTQDENLSVEDVSGQPDPAWQTWKDAADAWDAAHPAFQDELDAHNAALANYNDVLVPAYNAAYQAWLDGGEVGDPPAFPDEPAAPDARPVEPPKVYPPCTYKFSLETVAHSFIGNVDEPVVEAEGSPSTTLVEWVENNPSLNPGPGTAQPSDTYTAEAIYQDAVSHSAWVSKARSALIPLLKLPDKQDEKTQCPLGTSCFSTYSAPVPGYGGTAYMSATLADYQFGIPDTENYAGYTAAHTAWKLAKTAWQALPPKDRGPEPVEPVKFSYYELQWAEAFFPDDWTEWKALKDEYDAAIQARKDWEMDKSGDKGTAPDIPPKPGAEPTRPQKTAERSWIWGGRIEDAFSPRYVLPLPLTVKGQTRTVNLMAKGSRSKTLGGKPRAFGEMFDFG